jgi:2-polyprenyl-3-methyl-5-hydroxy-6-metoxy-1,4-benzoquinol methylase
MSDFDAAAFDAFERASWERVAHAYLDGFARISVHTVDPLLDAIGARQGTRLLDVGCGPGVLSARAAARGCDVSGVDVAAPMLEIASSVVPHGAFVLATLAVATR